MKFLNEKQYDLLKRAGWSIKYPKRLGFKLVGKAEFKVELPNKIRSGIYDIKKIGSYTYIGDGEYHSVESIGRFCSIAGGQKWGLHEHYLDGLTTSPLHQSKFWDDERHVEFTTKNVDTLDGINKEERSLNDKLITIGNDVWIGDGVFIKKGVKVGDGAVIAARSVVVKDVAPYTIVGGVPAKKISQRANERQIERLLDIQWWNYDISILDGVDFAHLEKAISVVEERVNEGLELASYKTINLKSDLSFEVS